VGVAKQPPPPPQTKLPYGTLLLTFDTSVFLPRREQVASLALLADMTAQAKAVEIMIFHVNEVSTALALAN
jgi:hypothetical protein